MKHLQRNPWLLLAMLAGTTLSGFVPSSAADDAGETDRNTVVIDMAAFTGNRKVIKALEGTVRVTLKSVVDQSTTEGRILDTEYPYGEGNARVQPFAENIYTHAKKTLRNFRDQLEIGTDMPLREVYYDMRNPTSNSDTQVLYTEAEKIIGKAEKSSTAFFHEWSDRILCDMVFDIPAEIATPQTKRVAPCYRESDLKNLKNLLVTAARLYIKTVDQVREEVEQERALQKAAALQP